MAQPTTAPQRPPLRWYGGKSRIAKQIISFFPWHDVYVDAFGGGASVLLAKSRCHCEIYNDLGGDVVNLFRVLRDDHEALMRRIYLTPYSRVEYLAAYEPTEDRVEAARRFMYRAAAGFGSDCAYRPSGFRTTLDDGRYSKAVNWQTLCGHVPDIARRLRGVIIEQQDAMAIMTRFDSEITLHYVDPPYLEQTRKRARAGYQHEFKSLDEHIKLLTFLRTLKGHVVISGYDSALYNYHLAGWFKASIKARDQTNTTRQEVLWMNFKPESRA